MTMQQIFKIPSLRNIWIVSFNQDVRSEDIPFLEICEDLKKCLGKLSLNKSAILIVGAARACSAKLDELYNDFIKLDSDITSRNKMRISDEDEESELSSSSTEPVNTSNSRSSTQPPSTSSATPPTQVITSQQESTISQQGSTTSQHGSTTSQHRSTTSEPGSRSPSEPVSFVAEETHAQSDSSTDHEDYFPLHSETSDALSWLESSSDNEDYSPTYTTSESKRRELLITLYGRRTLSTITEEHSSFNRTAPSTHVSSTAIDVRVLSISLKSKTSRSDFRESNETPISELKSRKRQRPDSSIDISEPDTFENTFESDAKKRPEHNASDFNEAFTASEGSIEEYESDESHTSLEHSFIFPVSSILKTKSLKIKNKKNSKISCVVKDQGTQVTQQSNIMESEQHTLLHTETFPETRSMRDQDTQVSPGHSDPEDIPSDAGISKNIEDQETQNRPHQNELDIEQDNRKLPFSSVSVYGPCQCNQRIPCVIMYSSVQE